MCATNNGTSVDVRVQSWINTKHHISEPDCIWLKRKEQRWVERALWTERPGMPNGGEARLEMKECGERCVKNARGQWCYMVVQDKDDSECDVGERDSIRQRRSKAESPATRGLVHRVQV